MNTHKFKRSGSGQWLECVILSVNSRKNTHSSGVTEYFTVASGGKIYRAVTGLLVLGEG